MTGISSVRQRLPRRLQPQVRRLCRSAGTLIDPLLSDRAYLALRYAALFGRMPHLREPRTFNEKVLWRRLHDTRPLFRVLCDKVAVRAYVAARAGSSCLVQTYGVYDQPEDIPWDSMPAPCVVKAGHGCGWVRVIDDPAAGDREALKAELRRWLDTDYASVWRERHYTGVPRRLIVEQRLGAPGRPIQELKVLCFNGVPRLVVWAHDLLGAPQTAFYTPDTWERLPMAWGKPQPPDVTRPAALDEALALAAKLSEGLDFVRVDLYVDAGRVYFGELTFTPLGGVVPITPRGYDAWLGAFWTLPQGAAPRRRRTG